MKRDGEATANGRKEKADGATATKGTKMPRKFQIQMITVEKHRPESWD